MRSEPGVVDILWAKDIPGSNSVAGLGPFLAESFVTYFGQPVGLVVATTRLAAIRGAAKAEQLIEYENIGRPIITMEQAMEAHSEHEWDAEAHGPHFYKQGNDVDTMLKDANAKV